MASFSNFSEFDGWALEQLEARDPGGGPTVVGSFCIQVRGRHYEVGLGDTWNMTPHRTKELFSYCLCDLCIKKRLQRDDDLYGLYGF